MDKRVVVCSELTEKANYFDSIGEYDLANEFTKVAKNLSDKEITIREALNFGKMFSNPLNMVKNPMQNLAGMVGGGRKTPNIQNIINSIQDPTVKGQLQQQLAAYNTQQAATTKMYNDLLAATKPFGQQKMQSMLGKNQSSLTPQQRAELQKTSQGQQFLANANKLVGQPQAVPPVG
jgi:hypothetical protein